MQYCKTVTLRKRKLKNGTISLFLDFYPGYRDPDTLKLLRRKSLGIYIYDNPTTEQQKNFNAAMMEKAEALRCRMFEEVINERYDFLSSSKMKGDFLAYFRTVMQKKNQKWNYVYKHFERFIDGECTFEEVTVELCRRFREYLLTAESFSTGEVIARNSAAGYWSTFRGFLAVAFREQRIKTNVNEFLDKIAYVDSPKNTLSLEELRRLSETPCAVDVLRRASLFSCLTGLRRSDIINLTWDDVKQYADGGHYVEFISQKTKVRNSVPISREAYELLPEKKGNRVFAGFNNMLTAKPLQDWLSAAGIKKKITFHCFRHTYASLQIEMGTDIYTVQQLLAHKNVATTQIYARHSDSRKKAAAGKITLQEKDTPMSAHFIEMDGKLFCLPVSDVEHRNLSPAVPVKVHDATVVEFRPKEKEVTASDEDSRPPAAKTPTPNQLRKIYHPYLGRFSNRQLCHITNFLNANGFFADEVTVKQMEHFFACTLKVPLHPAHNGRFAYFLSWLRNKQLLIHNWQKMISVHRLIVSSKTGVPMKVSNISTCLSDYKSRQPSLDRHIAEFVDSIVEEPGSDSMIG